MNSLANKPACPPVKLKTLCVAGEFIHLKYRRTEEFPHNVTRHTDTFEFLECETLSQALNILRQDFDIDLVFLDADYNELTEMTLFVMRIREMRAKLPIVIFTSRMKDEVLHLLRSGASWHFDKDSPLLSTLNNQILENVFSLDNWDEIIKQYARPDTKPSLELGLNAAELAVSSNPEELYIIKRLFANSNKVHLFRMDDAGFSGSSVYTLRPDNKLQRILKIEPLDRVEAVRDKQERLIQSRLDHRIALIQGPTVGARYLGGACYTLAGSEDGETVTLTRFLQEENSLTKNSLKEIITQLQDTLERLYVGSQDIEARYWAPLYARVLPPTLIMKDATVIDPTQLPPKIPILRREDFSYLGGIPDNTTLREILQQVREGTHPKVILTGFEVAELDKQRGVLYLHDDLIAKDPSLLGLSEYSLERLTTADHPILRFTSMDHPILRFKVEFNTSYRQKLDHPVFRCGKRICIQGRVIDSQETLLAKIIEQITDMKYNFASLTYDLVGASYIAPLESIELLLWEVGRNNIISPAPQIAPVIHGDLNTGNILIEKRSGAPVWLIDFSEARASHIYLDIAKLETEIRTHIFYHLFEEAVSKGFPGDQASKFALLIEERLYWGVGKEFESLKSTLRDDNHEWYDYFYNQTPVYFTDLLYFLHQLRHIARTYGPGRFEKHYPIALFFQSIAALKYENLNKTPWAKRLALYCALVSSRRAIDTAGNSSGRFTEIRELLLARSALAVIRIDTDMGRFYLLQWNAHWEKLSLVGGKVNPEDHGKYAKTMTRELKEELGISSHNYVMERLETIQTRQFSEHEKVFKDYEFHIFQVRFTPQHPTSHADFNAFVERYFTVRDRSNRLASEEEIRHLRTSDGKPISYTVKLILEKINEISPSDENLSDVSIPLAFWWGAMYVVDPDTGKLCIKGKLINPAGAFLVESLELELMQSSHYKIEPPEALVWWKDRLNPDTEEDVSIFLTPLVDEAIVSLSANYYYDVQGRSHTIYFEKQVNFSGIDIQQENNRRDRSTGLAGLGEAISSTPEITLGGHK